MVDALVEEATRRSAVVWLQPDGDTRATPAWHVWHAGAALVVTGPGEQPLPGVRAGGRVLVLVRSKERQGDLLVRWWADVEQVAPGTPDWDEVVPLLHAARLNAPDGEEQPARWAREASVLRLVPDGTTAPVR